MIICLRNDSLAPNIVYKTQILKLSSNHCENWLKIFSVEQIGTKISSTQQIRTYNCIFEIEFANIALKTPQKISKVTSDDGNEQSNYEKILNKTIDKLEITKANEKRFQPNKLRFYLLITVVFKIASEIREFFLKPCKLQLFIFA